MGYTMECWKKKNELTFRNHEKGMEVAKTLLDENYVVMLSHEEDLLVLNWEWSPYADRNDVIFMARDEFEEDFDTEIDAIIDDIKADIKRGYIKLD